MNIKIITYRGEEITTLEALIINKIDGADYELGALETLTETIRNQTKLIAKLAESMNPSNEQLTDWLASYGETIEKLS